MPRPRDNQRQRVYDAEREAFNPLMEKGTPDLPTVADCQALVDRIVYSRWWNGQLRTNPDMAVVFGNVTVSDGRGRRRGGVAGLDIAMPGWTRHTYYLLHEIAHVMTPMRYAWHGPEFCRNYLALVDRWMGKDAGRALRAEFKTKRVRYRR